MVLSDNPDSTGGKSTGDADSIGIDSVIGRGGGASGSMGIVGSPMAACPADYILIDSGMGSGKTFDWSLLEGIDRDYFLAGGLSPANVSEAIARLHPYALDVSSGIEKDGVKDRGLVEAFMEAAFAGRKV